MISIKCLNSPKIQSFLNESRDQIRFTRPPFLEPVEQLLQGNSLNNVDQTTVRNDPNKIQMARTKKLNAFINALLIP